MYKLTLKDEGFGEQTGLETLLVEADNDECHRLEVFFGL
jgi:hypothetical protein